MSFSFIAALILGFILMLNSMEAKGFKVTRSFKTRPTPINKPRMTTPKIGKITTHKPRSTQKRRYKFTKVSRRHTWKQERAPENRPKGFNKCILKKCSRKAHCKNAGKDCIYCNTLLRICTIYRGRRDGVCKYPRDCKRKKKCTRNKNSIRNRSGGDQMGQATCTSPKTRSRFTRCFKAKELKKDYLKYLDTCPIQKYGTVYPQCTEAAQCNGFNHAPICNDGCCVPCKAQQTYSQTDHGFFSCADSSNTKMGSLQYDIKGQTYHISHLKTSDAYQNRKVGTVIMDEFLGYAEKSGAKQVTLTVRKSNPHAIKLYRNFGFVEDNNVDGENIYPGWLNMVKKFNIS